MSLSLGFIDTASLSNIKTLTTVKEDQLEESNIQAFRGGDNGLFVSEKSAKAEITLNFDYLQDSNYKDARDVLLNRAYPNKIYIREPGNISGAILTPSTAVNNGYILSNSNFYPALGDFSTEFTTLQYSRLNDFATPCSYSTGINDYVHFLFGFDLTTWFSQVSVNNLLRLTLFMQTPVSYRRPATYPTDPDIKSGILVRAYSFASASFIEIYRKSITLQQPYINQQAAGLRPITGYSKMSDFIGNGGGQTNKVYFLLTTLQPRNGVGTLYLATNYIALLVNGFVVRLVDNFNLNWREEVTVVGRTGEVKLSEI